MSDNALYVYGVVKSRLNLKWVEKGLNGENVYTVSSGNFRALVHDCKEKPYISEDPNKIRELIISHNKILDKAMEVFNGVIPLHFNTIIKEGEKSAQYNLKKWLNNDKERLEKIWSKTKEKKEYGIRIYYDREKVIREASEEKEIKAIGKSQEGKSEGLSYLLQSKAKTKINEIIWNRVNEYKKKFYDDIRKVTTELKINNSKIFIDEEKDLLSTLSVLVNETQIDEIKKNLGKSGNGFSFQLAGPFAPYSFAEDENNDEESLIGSDRCASG